MNKKRILLLLMIILCAALIGFFAVRGFSEQIALRSAGVDTSQPVRPVVELGILVENTQYKVLQATAKTGEPMLLRLEKNGLGFWNAESIRTPKEGLSYAEDAWMIGTGTQRYTATDVPKFNYEWHYVYTGSDAQKLIQIPAEQIPANTTIDIQQLGEFYLIHVVSFADPEVFQQLHIPTYLKDNGFIP